MQFLFVNCRKFVCFIYLFYRVDNKCANIFSTLEVDLSLQNILTHENTMHAEFLS